MSVIKNIMLFGVGVASLTREKVEELIDGAMWVTKNVF